MRNTVQTNSGGGALLQWLPVTALAMIPEANLLGLISLQETSALRVLDLRLDEALHCVFVFDRGDFWEESFSIPTRC